MYKKPLEYLDSICELLSISRATLQANWMIFVDAKARKDLGIHNGWKCNSIYIKKMIEAGLTSDLKYGDSAMPTNDYYVQGVDSALDNLATSITLMMLDVHWPVVAAEFRSMHLISNNQRRFACK